MGADPIPGNVEYVIDVHGPVQDGPVGIPHDRYIVYWIDEYGCRNEAATFADETKARAWARQRGWIASRTIKARNSTRKGD